MPAATAPSCTTEIDGSCFATTCAGSTSDAGIADAGALAPPVSAGTLTFAQGGSPPIAVMPGLGGAYNYNSVAGGATLQGGGTIGIMSSGDVVPTFTASVMMPNDITVNMPAAPAIFGEPIVVSRAADLPIVWLGGAPGNVQFYASQGPSGGPTATIFCSFLGGSGSGTVPAAALAHLSATDASGMPYTQLFVSAQSPAATVQAGGWTIQVTASGAGSLFATAAVQ